jgi:hypothetical protein
VLAVAGFLANRDGEAPAVKRAHYRLVMLVARAACPDAAISKNVFVLIDGLYEISLQKASRFHTPSFIAHGVYQPVRDFTATPGTIASHREAC